MIHLKHRKQFYKANKDLKEVINVKFNVYVRMVQTADIHKSSM